MRRLFLVRHAKAELADGRDDHERRLTDRGRADAKRVADALAQRNTLPELLVHSGAARAKETAEIFAAQWPRRVKLAENASLYDATESMLFARVRELEDEHTRIGLVGHNPGFGELAAKLAGSGAGRGLAAKYPTGAVAVLDFPVARWKDVQRHSGLLALYLTPADVEAGAG